VVSYAWGVVFGVLCGWADLSVFLLLWCLGGCIWTAPAGLVRRGFCGGVGSFGFALLAVAVSRCGSLSSDVGGLGVGGPAAAAFLSFEAPCVCGLWFSFVCRSVVANAGCSVERVCCRPSAHACWWVARRGVVWLVVRSRPGGRSVSGAGWVASSGRLSVSSFSVLTDISRSGAGRVFAAGAVGWGVCSI